MYHFSGPSASMKPPDEFELSLPRRGRPLVKGVVLPGGDNERFGWGPGEVVPEDLDRGGTYRCEEAVVNGFCVEGVGLLGCDVRLAPVVSVGFDVIVRGDVDVAVAAVVETCAVDTNELGVMPVGCAFV
jgi:hypothetical protein